MTYARFRHLAIERARPALSDDELRVVEAKLGSELPDSFREFLRTASGGHIAYVVDVPTQHGGTEPIMFGSVFSARDEDPESILKELDAAREVTRVPPGVLPFARDGGGSIVYLDLSPHGQGRVVAFVDGLPAWTGRERASGFVEIATSFDEYVSKLHIDRDDVLDVLQNDVSEQSHVDATEEWLDIGMPRWREQDAELAAAAAEARARVAT
jgi:cell wall assembly regulator SMI1